MSKDQELQDVVNKHINSEERKQELYSLSSHQGLI